MQFTHTANPVKVHATTILDVTDITKREPGAGQSSPDLMLRLADGRNYEAGIAMTSRHLPVPGDYLVTQEDGYEYLNPKDVFERKYSAIPQDTIITFDEFVQYGRDNGANIVGGMPWSFTYKGRPVSHENDQRYLINLDNGVTLNLTPGDVLVTSPTGFMSVRTQ